MKKSKEDARLDTRRRDFDKGPTSRESKVQERWRAGGFHRPGSRRK